MCAEGARNGGNSKKEKEKEKVLDIKYIFEREEMKAMVIKKQKKTLMSYFNLISYKTYIFVYQKPLKQTLVFLSCEFTKVIL